MVPIFDRLSPSRDLPILIGNEKDELGRVGSHSRIKDRSDTYLNPFLHLIIWCGRKGEISGTHLSKFAALF